MKQLVTFFFKFENQKSNKNEHCPHFWNPLKVFSVNYIFYFSKTEAQFTVLLTLLRGIKST